MMAGLAGGLSGFLAAKAAAARATVHGPVGSAAAALAAARRRPVPPDFAATLRAGAHVAVIAEFKRRSPSGGALTADVPATVARDYAGTGATALSVLTDGPDFGGSLADLASAAGAVALPVLRKDFIVDIRDVVAARAHGAAAVLLIVEMLTDRELVRLGAVAESLEMAALVEVKDGEQLERALDTGARVVGINNRDLATLAVDLRTTERLAARVPADVTLVSESGIRDARDVARMRDAGAHAVLVGESLLRLDGTARAGRLAELCAVPR